MQAILVISHGSRSSRAREEVALLSDQIRRASGIGIVEYAFLKELSPDVLTAVQSCAVRGTTEITILPHFLNSGKHVTNDIPAMVRELRVQYPQIEFLLAPPVGLHPRMADLFMDTFNQAQKEMRKGRPA